MNKKICISGYYGFDNFGDETILKVLTENLKNFESKPLITVFSSNPEKTSKLYDVNSIYSFDIKNIIKEIRNCDCLISGGGSLLQDSTSKKSLIYYLFIIFLAEIFSKKVIIFAQGIGPIKNKFLSYITSKLLKKSSYITVRDEKSLNQLKEWNINAELCNDPVWNLNIDNKEKKDIIGIQLRGWKTLTNSVLFEFAKSVNEYYSSNEIYIFSLQNTLDSEICRRFNNFLLQINPNINSRVVENSYNEKMINDISYVKSIIAMRYHACLIGIKSGVNVLPFSYDIKVENLAKQFNLEYLKIEEPEKFNQKIKNFKETENHFNKEQIKDLTYNFELLEKHI